MAVLFLIWGINFMPHCAHFDTKWQVEVKADNKEHDFNTPMAQYHIRNSLWHSFLPTIYLNFKCSDK